MSDAASALRLEFDRLAAQGRRIDLWWRDDDAVEATPALDRLLQTAGGLPLSLAVVPSHANGSLPDRLRGEDGVAVLVHGWRHANHAPPGEKKSEFGPHRLLSERLDDAAAGLRTIRRLFGARALPVFVPPWNRLAPDLAGALRSLGYRAHSRFGEADDPAGHARIDTHLDPVDWHGTRSLVSPERLVVMMRRALARGAGRLGLLTHHLAFDEALWSFCRDFSALAADHPAIRPAPLAALLPAERCATAPAEPEGVPA